MGNNQNEFISLTDLGMAYRKAKVDAFYSAIPDRLSFMEYEKNLHKNLKQLHEALSIEEQSFDLGSWTLVPHDINNKGSNEQNGFSFSDPQKKWDSYLNTKNNKINAEFRIMARPSVDFHVLSALWIAKVGHLYDACLNEATYGYRLRRKKNDEFNPYSLGNFKPYLKPFKDWRDNGLNIMRSSLDKNGSIIAITSDISSFYHELNPDFMLNRKFIKTIGLTLNPEQRSLNNFFIKALRQWANETPLKKGLPVGLPASAIVANLALIELDRVIQKEIAPLYYGRYVDDIILVIKNVSNFDTTNDVWEWIFQRTNGLLQWKDNKSKDAIQFSPSYLKKSKIEFHSKKSKIFLLDGESGRTIINSIKNQIQERASEWRALPDLPSNPDHVAFDILSAVENDGGPADNLRKADKLSLRKAGFAIKLRDFEAYERDLHPKAWQEHRRAFLSTFIQHVLVLPSYFYLAIYLPRVIRLATACEDFAELHKIIKRLNELIANVEKNCTATIKACPDENCPGHPKNTLKWKKELDRIIDENIKAAFPPRLKRNGEEKWRDQFKFRTGFNIETDIKKLQEAYLNLFSHDLAQIPFRFIGMPKEILAARQSLLPDKKTIQYFKDKDALLQESVENGLKVLGEQLKCYQGKSLPYGILFATRPFNLTEVSLLYRRPYAYPDEKSRQIAEIIFSLRGFTPKDKLFSTDKKGNLLKIKNSKKRTFYKIVLASWKTQSDSLNASIFRHSDPDLTRYKRLTSLLNKIIRDPAQIDYCVFPELSIPPCWFFRAAHKLQKKGISLIAGVEYLHKPRKIVRNQVWAALTYDGLGFPSMMLYRQDKQQPALHEEKELQRIAGITMKPESPWDTPPIIKHGEIQLAILICSELTNITYRSALRGKVDALFVPEWNRDTETFNALVESAALDIHAFIIQCNDRQYGDSRIRAPYKDSWKRDIMRIKGGKNDYFVVGEIDIRALRQFQSNHRSPEGPFKPVPDGFNLSLDFDRKVLPIREDINGQE